jgi:hypothetical protein
MTTSHRLKKSMLLMLLFMCLGSAQAQLIWPGDVNNNGEVNVVDLLYLGIAFGETGPVRPDATTEFTGQEAGLPWSQNFPNGINYAYADADGNGVVDEDDLDDGIEDNYGLQHGVLSANGYANGAPGTGPALKLVPTAGVVGTGAAINIDLLLGESGAPVEDFYGIALQLSYRTAKGSETTDELDFEAADSPWYDPAETASLEFYFNDDDTGDAALALTRTDQMTVSGEGVLGRFSVVIEDIIANEMVDTFIVAIDSILLIDGDLTPRAVAPTETRVIVAVDPGSVTSTQNLSGDPGRNALRVWPNPVRSQVRVLGPDEILGWRLTDPTGRAYSLTPERIAAGTYALRFPPGVPPGVYFLQARTPGGIWQEKIIYHSQF